MSETATRSLPLNNSDSSRPSVRTWLAIASLSLGAFVLVATEFLPIGALPLVAREFDVSLGTSGLMVLVPGLVAAVAAPLVVVWSARLPRNVIVLMLGSLLVASNAIAYFAPDFTTIVLARVLLGIALGGFWAVAPSLGFRLAGPGFGPRATSIVLAGISAGTVIGLPAGQLLGGLFGWRVVFGSAAILSLVVLIAQVVLLPNIARTKGLNFGSFARVFRSPLARVGLAVAVLVVIGQFAASTFLTPFLEHEARFASGAISPVYFAYGAAGILGTLVGGFLVAKNHRATLVGIPIALGLTLVLLVWAASLPVIVAALLVLWGLLWGIVPLMLQTWLMASMPFAPEAASAVLVTTFQISIAAGSLLGGLLVDSSGLAVAYVVAGVVIAAAALVPLLSAKRPPAPARD